MQSIGMIDRDRRDHSLARAASTLTVANFFSPATGVLLEAALAYRFGSSSVIDSFRTAYLLIGVGTALFVGQTLPHIVVPLVSAYRTAKQEQEGWRIAFSAGHGLTLLCSLFAVYVCIRPGDVISALGPGLHGAAETEAFFFIRFYAIAFVMMIWCGIINGILYVHGLFFLPPLSQIINNLVLLSFIFVMRNNAPRYSLAIGTAAGFTLVLATNIAALCRVAKRQGFALPMLPTRLVFGHLKQLSNISIPVLGIVLCTYVTAIAANRELSKLPGGSVAHFGYAWKLLLIVGLAPSSLATVIFPGLSAKNAAKLSTDFARSCADAVRLTLLLAAPLSIFLYVFRDAVVRLLFGRGAMSETDIAQIGMLFGLMLFQAPAGALLVLLNKVSFSLAESRAPTTVALLTALGAVVFMPVGATLWGAAGIALTFDMVTIGSTLGLFAYHSARKRMMQPSELMQYISSLTLFCAGIGLGAVFLRGVLPHFGNGYMILSAAELAVAALILIVVGYALSKLLRLQEGLRLAKFFKWEVTRLLYGPAQVYRN